MTCTFRSEEVPFQQARKIVYSSLGFHPSTLACYQCRISAAARHAGEEIRVEYVENEDLVTAMMQYS